MRRPPVASQEKPDANVAYFGLTPSNYRICYVEHLGEARYDDHEEDRPLSDIRFRVMRSVLRAAVLAGCLTGLLAAQANEVLEPVIDGLPRVTDIENAGDGSGRLFLVQQNGIIRILEDGALRPMPFLDIQARTRADGEQGLLGLAFPPDYARKGYFYLDYTTPAGDTHVSRFRIGADPNVAEAASEQVLLTVEQPFANHNGGQIRFGPDGYLYIGMGDGGSANDPLNNAQNLGSLLGKLLRIDVEPDLGRLSDPARQSVRRPARGPR